MKFSRRTGWLTLIFFIALTAHLLPGPRTVDDAFITFRYARNLLAGSGFVFNPGEQVQGTTTPLYALLMTGLGASTGGPNAPFPVIAWLVNGLASAATAVLIAHLGQRAGSERAGLAAAAVWAVAPYSVSFAVGGLETSVYGLLLTGLTAAYLARRRTITGLLGALAILTRPDAVLLVGPLMLHRLYCALRKNEPLQAGELLAFALPCAAWGLFAWSYFGSPIPHSVTAKLQVYRLSEGDALIRLVQHYATPFLLQNLVGAGPAVAAGLILFPFLYLLGARTAFGREPRLLAWLAYPWLYFLVFALPNPLIFRWYLTPPLPAYFLMILIGLDGLLSRLLIRPGKPARAAWVMALLLVLPLVSTLSEWRLRLDHGPANPAPEMAFIKLEELYREAARRTAPQMSAQTVLAAGDVGVLGYYTPARILDTVGLNSPAALQYYPIPAEDYVINYAVPAEMILNERPDWVILLEVYVRRTLLQNEDFLAQYELVDTLPTDMYGSSGMLIWKRR